jgi:glutamate-1-semialdehyde aminotransferase/acyl carrier protein
MSATKQLQANGEGRRGAIISMLTVAFGTLFGRDASELDVCTPLIELGADSLFLLQASQAIAEKFKVKIPFRLLLEELSTIDALASHLEGKLPESFASEAPPAETAPATAPVESAAASVESAVPPHEPPAAPRAASGAFADSPPPQQQVLPADSPLQAILSQQLRIMSQQLELLRGEGYEFESRSAAVEATAPPRESGADALPAPPAENAFAATAGTGRPDAAEGGGARPQSPGGEIEPETFVPYRPVNRKRDEGLDERQRKHLDALIERVCRRTPETKRLTQAYRPYLADSRVAAGFRPMWKEMVYPPLVSRAEGSRIWDVDGNEYVDVTMGFGALLFGHSPGFITEALREQLRLGIQIGPHSHIAGRVARLICEMTGVERVSFCNSGTEAVMSALRIARAATGRTKIALFEGCYHGTFDGVLVRGLKQPDGRLRAAPMAPGVPQHMIENVLLLKYNDPESLELLRAEAHELAAVLIEPPRSRRPDVQPKEFLRRLREITDEAGAALIFDEVVTGFRFHPGGAQAMFGVQADLVTYGKAVGGGVPVAVVAGKAAFMDAVDGGMWTYGDASFPEADVTYFTGTYFKHPLIMPALWASLNYIKEHSPRMQEELDARTTRIADELNAHFARTRVPLKVAHLGSLFRILHSPALKYADLLYYHLLEKGVYVCETRNCFLSTAHTDEDVEYVIRAVAESVDEMREAGFLPELPEAAQARPDAARDGAHPAAQPSGAVARAPLTESQRQVWAMAQMGDEEARAYNLSTGLRLRGPLDMATMRAAVGQIVARHEALRATIDRDGDFQEIAASLDIEVPLTDLSALAPGERETRLSGLMAEESRRVFDLARGPLLSVHAYRLADDDHLVLFTMHHVISDGWSFGTILRELRELYSAARRGEPAGLPEPRSFSDYARLLAEKRDTPERAEDEGYWLKLFAGELPSLELPTDRPRPNAPTYAGAQQRMEIGREVAEGLKQLSARQGCTLFMTTLAAFKVLLYHLTGQSDLVVGTPSAGQVSPEGGYLVGYCVNLLPLRSRVEGGRPFTDYLASLKRTLAEAYDHQGYPYSTLVKLLSRRGDAKAVSLVSAIFNLDRTGPKQKFHDLDLEVVPNHNRTSKFDVTLDVTDTGAGLVLDLEYNTDLFDDRNARLWMEHYEAILRAVISRPGVTPDELRETLRRAEERRQAALREEFAQARVEMFKTTRRRAFQGG